MKGSLRCENYESAFGGQNDQNTLSLRNLMDDLGFQIQTQT